MPRIKIAFIVGALLCGSSAAANQRIFLEEGSKSQARISSKNLNHIAIENDRIASVKALAAQFELDKDPELGQIFIKPLETAQNPLTLFLSTESGKTYVLDLVIEEQGAESIVLVPPAPVRHRETECRK